MQSSIWKLLTAVGIIAIGTLVVLQVQHRLPGLRPPAESVAQVPAEGAGAGDETTFTPDSSTEFDSVLDEAARKAAPSSDVASTDGVNDPGLPAPPAAEHQTFVSASRTVKKDQLTDEPNPFALEEPGEAESDSVPVLPVGHTDDTTPTITPATFEGTTDKDSSLAASKAAGSQEESTPIFPAADDANPFPPAETPSTSTSASAAAPEKETSIPSLDADTATDKTTEAPVDSATPKAAPAASGTKPDGILFFGKEEGAADPKNIRSNDAGGKAAKSASGTNSALATPSEPAPKASNFEPDNDVPIMMVPEPVPSVNQSPSASKSATKASPPPAASEPNPFESDGPVKANAPIPSKSPAPAPEPSPFNADSETPVKPVTPKAPAQKSATPKTATPKPAASDDPFFSDDDTPTFDPPGATKTDTNKKSVQTPARDRRVTPAGAQQSADSNTFEINADEPAFPEGNSARPAPRGAGGSVSSAGDMTDNPFPDEPANATPKLPAADEDFPAPEYPRETSPSRPDRSSRGDSTFGDDAPFGGPGDERDANERPSNTRPLPAMDDEPATRSGRDGSKLGPATTRTVSEVMRPQLTIQKKAPESAVVGVSHEYKILVSNEGDSPAFDVIVEDDLGLAAEYISSRPVAEYNQSNGQLSWNFPELAPRETREITVRIKPTGEGTLDGVATVRFKAQVRSATVIKSPKLELELNGPAEVKVGDEVRLEFAIHNRGTGDASDVVLRSVLPPGLRHPEGGDLEYEIETLRAGASEVVDLTVVAAEPGDQIRVSAELTSSGVQVTTSHTDIKIVGAQLSIERLGPEKRFVGRTAQFQNIITNETNFEATNAFVIEQVPEGMRFISASNGGTYNPDTRRIRWDIARLAPGKQTVLEVELAAETAGEMESMVEISEAAGFRTRARENTIVKVEDLHNVTADISRQDKPVAIGEKFGFTITIDNRGTAIARNVEVAVQIPPDIKVLAAGTKDVPGNLVEGRNIVRFATVQAIRPNEKMTFTIKLQGQAAVKNAVVQGSLKYDEMSEPLIVSESVTVFDDRL
ncbi:MAG: hypothetical protein JNM43_21845 [Planctomycetaceae bacterium]|nr:hypothetical protein [Planctomycetaceae bacterium]